MKDSDLYKLLKLTFELPPPNYPGRIAEVKIGATEKEGGTRRFSLRLGGEGHLPFFSTKDPVELKPPVAMQVFDSPSNVPIPVKGVLGDVIDDPVAWAKLCVLKYGAEAIALSLISTNPNVQNRSPAEASSTVEDVLQAVDVPLIIFGSGSSERDPEVLERVAEVAEGERCVLASATLNNDYKRIAMAALKGDHVVLATTDCDPVLQRTLNNRLLDLGLGSDHILIDPTTAALGYGLEYSTSITERIRLNALKGDNSLQSPIVAITTHAWTARESFVEDSSLGSADLRGPLWEAHTGVPLFLAGADLFIMLHPHAVSEFKKLLSDVFSEGETKVHYLDWIGV